MKNKIFLSTLVFLGAVATAGALKIGLVNAALLPAYGWPWGGSEDSKLSNGSTNGSIDGNESGIGWVSFNSTDPGAGGGAAYAVNIPSTDGPASGYAWSSNLKSYVDFAPHAGCPTETYPGKCDAYPIAGGTDVMRVGSQLKGWARIVNIAVAKKSGNSGGEDGWINLDPGVSGFGVNIAFDGKVSGYGWAGAALGAMSFSAVEVAAPPVLFLSVTPFVYLEPGEVFTPGTKRVDVSWTASSRKIASCTRTCTDSSGNTLNCNGWTGNTSIAASGNVSVPLPAPVVTFKMTCKDENTLEKTVTAEVKTGCSVGVCNASTQKCEAHKGTFHIATDGDSLICKGGCQVDSDCTVREGIDWREVAP